MKLSELQKNIISDIRELAIDYRFYTSPSHGKDQKDDVDFLIAMENLINHHKHIQDAIRDIGDIDRAHATNEQRWNHPSIQRYTPGLISFN